MSTKFEGPSKDFSAVITADGSPTALGPTGEPMHSLEGALSETLYIYGPVVDTVLERSWRPRFLSLGLGLGYVEMMTVARVLKSKLSWTEFYLHSFELEESLRSELQEFLNGDAKNSIYQKVLDATALAHGLPADELFETLRALRTEEKWVVDGALTMATRWQFEKFSGVFFDAFSSKSSPELWSESFFDSFLTSFAAPYCMLSTYAATGVLKRSLAAHNFQVNSHKGFGKKRQSTQGLRA